MFSNDIVKISDKLKKQTCWKSASNYLLYIFLHNKHSFLLWDQKKWFKKKKKKTRLE